MAQVLHVSIDSAPSCLTSHAKAASPMLHCLEIGQHISSMHDKIKQLRGLCSMCKCCLEQDTIASTLATDLEQHPCLHLILCTGIGRVQLFIQNLLLNRG